VRYAVLHGWMSLAQGSPSDVDLVIAADDLRRLEASLHQRYQILTIFHYEASSFGFVLADKDRHGASLLIADFTMDYRWSGRVFFTDQELLHDRRRWQGFWVVGPRQAFTYLLVKKVYEKGSVPALQRASLKELALELGQEAYSAGSSLFGKVWGSRIIDWIAQERWTELEASIEPLRRGLRRQVIKRDPLNPVRYWLPETWRVWQRWWYPTGLLVAVFGPDGCGKSTLIQHLQAMLVEPFRRTVAFHLRPRLISRNANDGPVTDPHGKPPYSWWLSLLKIPYYLLEYGLGYLFQVRPRLVRSTLVLFDRYYDDLLVDPRRYRYGGPLELVRLARRLIPRPDLVLILDASEDQLMARKREVSPAELRRQRAAYRRLAAELPNAVLLDGSLPAAQVAQDACEVTLDYLHERYLKRRHLWFRDDGSETLDWLSSVLFPGQKARLTLSNPARDDSKAQWQRDGSFGWLALKDGRGYLIPLDSCQSGANALRLYNAQNLKARGVKRLLMVGLKAGISWPLLRRVQLINRQDVSEKAKSTTSLLEHLKGIFGRDDLTFAISFGTPGPHRKPVVQIMTYDGEVLGYAKVGRDDATNRLVQNEVQMLQVLAPAHLRAFTVPRVLHSGWWEDHFVCVLSASKGVSDRARQMLTPLHLAALKELRVAQVAWGPLQESSFWITLCCRIRQTHHTYYRHVLEQGIAKAEVWVGKTPLPFQFCHGDFTPWNMRQDGKKLFIFDWEYASEAGPPAWDLFHFRFETMRLLKQWNACAIYASLVENERFRRGRESALAALDLEEKCLKPFLLLYLLDRLAFHAATGSEDLSLQRTLSAMVNLLIVE
jgi:thymidylate kinase